MPPVVVFKSIKCIETSEAGEDETYLEWDGRQIWPVGERYKDMNDNYYYDIDLACVIQGDRRRARLLEYDTRGDIDLLGETYINVSEAGTGVQDWKCTGDGGNYLVKYEVVA